MWWALLAVLPHPQAQCGPLSSLTYSPHSLSALSSAFRLGDLLTLLMGLWRFNGSPFPRTRVGMLAKVGVGEGDNWRSPFYAHLHHKLLRDLPVMAMGIWAGNAWASKWATIFCAFAIAPTRRACLSYADGVVVINKVANVHPAPSMPGQGRLRCVRGLLW